MIWVILAGFFVAVVVIVKLLDAAFGGPGMRRRAEWELDHAESDDDAP